MTGLILIVLGWFAPTWYKDHLDHKNDPFNDAVDKRIDKKLEPIITRLNEFDVKLASINGKLDILILDQSAAQPNSDRSAGRAARVLNDAQSLGEKIDPDSIRNAGIKFIEGESPSAWKTALVFLDYRSFLNSPYSPDILAKFEPVPGPQKPSDVDVDIVVKGGPLTFDISWSHDLVPGDQAFLFQPITGLPFKPPSYSPTAPRHSFLSLHNPKGTGTIRLDGMNLRNIIFRDMRITYEGGPLIMKNVYFVNCTFEIPNIRLGQKFATAVLSGAPSTDFTS
jgi:hypothetical protein